MSVDFKFEGKEQLSKELNRLMQVFPDEVRKIILETAIVDIESFAKTNDIPVDTGRLRSSIHTKYIKNVRVANSETKTTYSYSDSEGNTYNGTLQEGVDINSVVVGTNVAYAGKINRDGGGGLNSGRTAGGFKKPKGYGQSFMDIAWNNGKRELERNLRNLVKRVDKL